MQNLADVLSLSISSDWINGPLNTIMYIAYCKEIMSDRSIVRTWNYRSISYDKYYYSAY
jgi:hypothetical protein